MSVFILSFNINGDTELKMINKFIIDHYNKIFANKI